MLCRDCPLYEACVLAHAAFFGAVLADCGVESYRECEYYRKCRDSVFPKDCIEAILLEKLEQAKAIFEEEDEE